MQKRNYCVWEKAATIDKLKRYLAKYGNYQQSSENPANTTLSLLITSFVIRLSL